MRKLLAMAAFLLASTAAQAQYTFEYGGKTIRVDPDRGTVSIPGVYDNTEQKKAKRTKRDQDGARKQQPTAADPPAQAPSEAGVTPGPQPQDPVSPAPVSPAPASTAA